MDSNKRVKTCSHKSVALDSRANAAVSQECSVCFATSPLFVCVSCLHTACKEHFGLHYRHFSSHSLSLSVTTVIQKDDSDKVTMATDGSLRFPKTIAPIKTAEFFCFQCESTAECDSEPFFKLHARILGASTPEQKALEYLPVLLSCVHVHSVVTAPSTSNLNSSNSTPNSTLNPKEPNVQTQKRKDSCSECSVAENLWLCLTCGNIGCGRAHFDGTGGNSHARTHNSLTSHPLACKLGTISADGLADVFCYVCDDDVLDTGLGDRLALLGIDVGSRQKTEKTTGELQLALNMSYDFAMTDASGASLPPVYGPGLTGLRNLGNTCYLASVLQSVVGCNSFVDRYASSWAIDHVAGCGNITADCFHCQMIKIVNGLLSGEYSKPTDPEHPEKGQRGIPPQMLKLVLAKNHVEFSSARQQDAIEFLEFFFTTVQQRERGFGVDPTKDFIFGTEQKIQCSKCHGVKFASTPANHYLLLPVPASTSLTDKAVSLESCLKLYKATEEICFRCPNCGDATGLKSNGIGSWPKYLCFGFSKFVVENWVPKKMDVEMVLPLNETIDLSYLKLDRLPSDVLLPDSSDAAPAAAAAPPPVDESHVAQLESMGFGRIRCAKALRAVKGSGVEAAMNWIFEHMDDADIDIEVAEVAAAKVSPSGRLAFSEADIGMLVDMGFTPEQGTKALSETDGNLERAIEWLFSRAGSLDDEGTAVEPSSVPPFADTTMSESPKYTLQAIVSHKGSSVHCGHYVAHVKREGRWILFNDEKVVDASSQVECGDAYLVVLRRTD